MHSISSKIYNVRSNISMSPFLILIDFAHISTQNFTMLYVTATTKSTLPFAFNFQYMLIDCLNFIKNSQKLCHSFTIVFSLFGTQTDKRAVRVCSKISKYTAFRIIINFIFCKNQNYRPNLDSSRKKLSSISL